MEIGNKIRSARIRMNLTQEELAKQLNVTPQAVSRWENNISMPDVSMIPLLAEKLKVSADYLLLDQSNTFKFFDSCKDIVLEGELMSQNQIDCLFSDIETAADDTAKKVLIVDDSDFMRMMLKDMLTKSGHEIVEADNGKTAVKVFENEKPDVCILDINMPEMNGLEVLEYIVSRSKETPVIMLSALSMESVVKEALEKGAIAFVAKPFQADSLIRRVGYPTRC